MMISVFWIFAVLMIAAAIGLLSIPLWRRSTAAPDEGLDALVVLRDQKQELDREVEAGRMTAEEREQRIAELSRRVVEEGLTAPVAKAAAVKPLSRRGLAIAFAILIPIVAFGGYFLVGTPAALDPASRAIVARSGGHGDISPQQFREMLAELKTRLDKNPNDVTGWKMLGGGLRFIDDFAGAADAYKRATDLAPTDAQAFADYADALAMAQGRSLTGKPAELVQKALQIDPKLPKALALAGTIELEKGNKPAARAYYVRLLATVEKDPAQADEVRSIIAEIDGVPPRPPSTANAAMPGSAPMLAQQGAAASAGPGASPPASPAASPPPSPAPPASSPAGAAAPGAVAADPAKALTGTITLGPAVAAEAKPDDTVYIFARAAQGPRMPLAILRHKVSELPLKFRLDDTNGMAGGPTLSSASSVKVEARVSKTGDAIPKPGDLRGESAVVAPGAANLSIVIDQIVR